MFDQLKNARLLNLKLKLKIFSMLSEIDAGARVFFCVGSLEVDEKVELKIECLLGLGTSVALGYVQMAPTQD